MKRKTIIFLTITFIFSNCINEKKEKPSIKVIDKVLNNNSKVVIKDSLEIYGDKFSGNYTVQVDGVSGKQEVEVYGLNSSGKATWVWAENNGNNGVIVDDRKEGTWRATKNSVTIDIKGNTEMISETFVIKNGVLRNPYLKKRHLRKIKSRVFE